MDDTVAPIFLYFLIAGLLPPFSDFFLAVLEHYQVRMLHLHPNAVLTLAIFTHLCEAFVGVMPSLELFRHFFAMRLIPRNRVSSCVCFRLASKAKAASFISLGLYTHVKEWRRKWVLTDTLRASLLLREPDTQAEKRAGWATHSTKKAAFAPVLQRIKHLVGLRLTGPMLALNFIRLRLAPLQARQQPAWSYEGD